jgi:integrase
MKANAANERIKRDYFRWLGEAKGRDEATIDAVARALARFEDSTRRTDFKKFHWEQAVAFRKRLADAVNARTGEKLSKTTMLAMLRDLKGFFEWLSREPGYRASLNYADAAYFSLTGKEEAIARARRETRAPSVEQMGAVLAAMPEDTIWERRDRALLAFACLTGARVSALASFQLGDVDVASRHVDQDARHVRTKGGKTFRNFFMPWVENALEVVAHWTRELAADHLWGPGDPLFPPTVNRPSEGRGFAPAGLSRKPWASSEPVREAFHRAFAAVGLPYFNPHSLRTMLVRHAMNLGFSPEQMKALSQNLGHADVLTTFTSYGSVPTHRQGELIRGLSVSPSPGVDADQVAALKALIARIEAGRPPSLPDTPSSGALSRAEAVDGAN